MKIKNILVIAVILGLFLSSPVWAMIKIVAAESVYGHVAAELAGPYVQVNSILNNPSQDPHLFTITPSTAKALYDADIIIYNGAGYDPWIYPLLKLKGQEKRKIIDVSSLLAISTKDNPHIWYYPGTMPLFAAALINQLQAIDSEHQDYYKAQLQQFIRHYTVIDKKITQLANRFAGTPVIATEPIYGYMVKNLGLKMQDEGFQVNMMNDIPPTISQIKAFENDLRQHKVKVLIYNDQVINPLTQRMKSIAHDEGIPVVGISETKPANMTYIQWIMSQLQALEMALEKSQGSQHE